MVAAEVYSSSAATPFQAGVRKYVAPPASKQPNGKLPYIKHLVLPEGTVLNVRLQQPLHSEESAVNDLVSATVVKPVYIGPYLMIPENSTLTGWVAAVNDKRKDKEGLHPYVVVGFDQLVRPGEGVAMPFNAVLIAYKTGLRKSDSVWKLPQKGDGKRNAIRGTIGGAVSGALINPVIGTAVGAGAGLGKALLIDRVARGGSVKIKANKEVSIATQMGCSLPPVYHYRASQTTAYTGNNTSIGSR
jgi:hypothetical protein